MPKFKSKLNLRTAKASRLEKIKTKEAADKTARGKKLTAGKAASARKAKSEKEASDLKAKTDAQIERINELSKMARGTWFSLLGYLAFVGVTLLAVEDADFFVSTRKTQLPIVNIPIPTASFFIFGPILGTALFVYLHLYLIRLWDALEVAEETIDGTSLSEKVMPWLINDYGLSFRDGNAFKNRPLDWVSHKATFILVFAAAPTVIGYFWVRHWPSHAALLSSFLAILFAITLITSIVSYHSAYYRLRKREPYIKKTNHMLALFPFLGICVVTLGITAFKVGGISTEQKASEQKVSDNPPQDAVYTMYDIPLATSMNWLWGLSTLEITLWPKSQHPYTLDRLFTLSRANLFENDLIGRPAGWLGYGDQKHAFRKVFCKGEDLPPAVCGPIPELWHETPVIQENARQKWAKGFELTNEEQTTYFAKLENRFQSDWKIEHTARIDALPRLNLRGHDLRNANGYATFLSNVSLRHSNLSEANLRGAKLERADLLGVNLEKADLSNARLERANLSSHFGLEAIDYTKSSSSCDEELKKTKLDIANGEHTILSGANLSRARLEGANLRDAVLIGTKLGRAKMQDTDLSCANLTGANLGRAKLEGTNLIRANLVEANLMRAKIQSVRWIEAKIGHSPAHSTDFRGSIGLTQDMLKNVIGNEETLLFASEHSPLPSERYRLHVWSCWEPENLPPNLDQLLEWEVAKEPKETIRARWVCSDTNPRVPTGTTKPLDAE